MNAFLLVTIFAALATVFSFVSGVIAMNRHGAVGHRSSAEWMTWRVVFQAATFLAILAAPLSK
jgi:hypothetical protein